MTTPNHQAELLPCPFCAGEVSRIESMARAFQPARLFHEYHHPKCRIIPALIWSGEAGSVFEAAFIAAWNTRPACIKHGIPIPDKREEG